MKMKCQHESELSGPGSESDSLESDSCVCAGIFFQLGTCTHTTLTCSHSRDADRREQRRSRVAVVVRLSRRDDQDMALIESILGYPGL